MATLGAWGYPVERRIFLGGQNLFAEFVNLLLLPIMLLLEELSLFGDVTLMIFQVLRFHQFVADFTLCLQYGTLSTIIAAAKRLKELIFIGRQMSGELLIAEFFELAVEGARPLQHESAVALEMLDVVVVQEFFLVLTALFSGTSKLGRL